MAVHVDMLQMQTSSQTQVNKTSVTLHMVHWLIMLCLWLQGRRILHYTFTSLALPIAVHAQTSHKVLKLYVLYVHIGNTTL